MENGQLHLRENYKDGRQEGLEEWFYDNGQLKWKVNYQNGKRDVLWETFDEEGNLTIQTEEYKDGELVE